MKTLDPIVFYAVLIEMMGPALFWFLVLLAVAGIFLFARVLIREKGLSNKRLIHAEIIGILGGFGALVLMGVVSENGK